MCCRKNLLVLVSTCFLAFIPACAGWFAHEGRNAGECSDEADNDGDGLFDCDDPDCTGSAACDEVDTAEPAGTDNLPIAAGIQMDAIYLYQGIEVHWMQDGALVEDAPVSMVGGRDMLIRVFVSPIGGWVSRTLVLRVQLVQNGHEVDSFRTSASVTGTSWPEELESSMNITIPGDALNVGTAMRVELLEESEAASFGGDEGRVVFPAEEPQSLGLNTPGPTLSVVLVPIRYEADGSGRLPDTSDAAIERYRRHLYARFPVATVELTVGDEFVWDQSVSASGAGWSTLLSAVGEQRALLGAGDNTYIYGLFEPAESLNTFCSGGCVPGLANLVSSAYDVWSRAAIGLAWDEVAPDVMSHQLGHNHGLSNVDAGCGSGGGASDYPHAGGHIGERGYDFVEQELLEPDTHFDFMSYCSPAWVSDYTFERLLDRAVDVDEL